MANQRRDTVRKLPPIRRPARAQQEGPHTPPQPRLADGWSAYRAGEVDLEQRPSSGRRYAEALRTHGWETIEVEAADDCPDSVFVEDTVVMYKNVALISRPGASSRARDRRGRGGGGPARLLGELDLGARHLDAVTS